MFAGLCRNWRQMLRREFRCRRWRRCCFDEVDSRGKYHIECVVDKIEATSVISQLIADMVLIPHSSIPSLYTYNSFHVSPFEVPESVSSELMWNFPFDYFFKGMSRILQQDHIFVIPKIDPILNRC